MYYKVKRYIDIVLSLSGIVILFPVLLLIVLVIKFDSKGPVLFRQKRIGIHKSNFFILKFRTMRAETPKDMPTHQLIAPEKYITRVGSFLRKTSLDELPQLFNILAGDMSIIGPRPALWNQTDLVLEREKYGANAILPGLTGWAQINGRDELSIAEKARLDGEYKKRISFFFDCRCFLGTILQVIKRKGIVEGSSEAMKNSKKVK